MNKIKRCILIVLAAILLVIFTGLVLLQPFVIPVEGAVAGDWNPQSFWAYPWGKSVTHKGVDIFAKKGTPVISATYGLVLAAEKVSRGGNIVLVLGPKWRLHYYAHLSEIDVKPFQVLKTGGVIGKTGNTGNAINTPCHLHYSIVTLIPYPWKADNSIQGWKKMFYLNPIDFFNN